MFRVGLFVLGGLRGLWGFCVREWLGGFGACGVFHLFSASLSVFLSFVLSLCLAFYPALLWLSLLVLLHCLSFSALALCFLFPLRTTRKKKGRKVFLRPLLSCYGFVISS